MTPEKYSDELVKTIDDAINAFNYKIPAHEKRVYRELLVLLKDLKTKNGKLINSVENLKTILKIKSKLEKLLLDKSYGSDLKEFTKAFDQVSELQNRYFATFTTKFTPPKVLGIVQEQSINSAINYLTKGGVQQMLVPKIEDILRQNITSGGSYGGMVDQIRDFLIKKDSPYQKYSKQVTTDALNQFSRAYTATITDDLGLEWSMYVGSLLKTSREFCIKLEHKRYVHKKELPEIVKGKIDGEQVKLNKKTGLPEGMYPDTNADNFEVLAGGYNCGHQNVPVNEVAVPKEVRIETYKKLGIKYDEKGYAVKA